nr:DNA alkylation response protein [Deltaproteobacteria bacterium]
MDRLPLTDLGTHRVDNQPDALIDYDPMRRDAALRDAVGREGAGWSADRLQRLSTSVGSEQYIEASMLANAHPPVLRRFDHAGRRVDEVVYTPAYHQLMGLGLAYWLAGLPWADPRQGSHVAHAAMVYLLSQADAGVVHPMSTTYAAVPLLRAQPDVAREWEHRLLAATYDPRCIPVHAKRAATIGLAVSSPDAGPTATPPSTLRATAHDTAGPGQTYALEGTLPICSAPMADAWITMATTSAGPSCFLVPRWCPDGQRNRLWLQRLRPTLGQRTSALAQLELPGSWARMIGDDGDGPATLTRMLHHVRLDAVVTRVACMRQALTQALHHARHRRVFGQPLLDQPLMRAVLADLALEVETAVALVMRVARSYDDARRDPSLQGASRLMVA